MCLTFYLKIFPWIKCIMLSMFSIVFLCIHLRWHCLTLTMTICFVWNVKKREMFLCYGIKHRQVCWKTRQYPSFFFFDKLKCVLRSYSQFLQGRNQTVATVARAPVRFSSSDFKPKSKFTKKCFYLWFPSLQMDIFSVSVSIKFFEPIKDLIFSFSVHLLLYLFSLYFYFIWALPVHDD